jgi:hypothetical protein
VKAEDLLCLVPKMVVFAREKPVGSVKLREPFERVIV